MIAKVCKQSQLIIESHETCFSVAKKYDYSSNPFLLFIAKLYDKNYYRCIDKYDRLVTLTKGDANEWSMHVSSIIMVIPNPLTYYPISMREKEKNHFCRIISAGRIEEEKGFDQLIEAFSIISDKCPKWHVVIFGKGSCENDLRKMIADKGLEKRISISSPTTNIYEEYYNSDLFVLSSRHEGFGMALLEAMSCGKTCVAFDCKYGPSEIIIHGETGLLVKDGNISEMANVILWAIEHSNERSRIGEAARESVKKYRKEIIMEQWVKLFNGLN